MFLLSGSTMDEAGMTSPNCLSCSAHTDGNSSPPQIMFRKTSTTTCKLNCSWMWRFEPWFLSSAAGGCTRREHDKSIFSVVLRAVALSSSLSWSRPPCFPWLHLISPWLKFDTAEYYDLILHGHLCKTSALAVRSSFLCLLVTALSWQQCDVVIMLLPWQYLTKSTILFLKKLAIIWHLFWFCSLVFGQ